MSTFKRLSFYPLPATLTVALFGWLALYGLYKLIGLLVLVETCPL